jgi:hypothetical protein
MKFFGTINQLIQLVRNIDIYGQWTQGRDKHQYRASNGSVLNWWPRTGTIYFQGPDEAASDFEAAISDILVEITQRSIKSATKRFSRDDAVDAPMLRSTLRLQPPSRRGWIVERPKSFRRS